MKLLNLKGNAYFNNKYKYTNLLYIINENIIYLANKESE